MIGIKHSALKQAVVRRTVSLIAALAFSFCVFSVSSLAQEPDDDAPPPLKQLSKDEKQKLESETDVKGHTLASLDLMNRRVMNAETLNSSHQYDEMYKELGGFNALMDAALKFLTHQDKDSGKVLNSFKRLDLGLRTFLPRLEIIRRDLPPQYEPYVKTLMKFINEAREKSLAPLFGNTVLREKPKH